MLSSRSSVGPARDRERSLGDRAIIPRLWRSLSSLVSGVLTFLM